MKPAVLLCWPKHNCYPVCEWNLERFKDYFDGIYIAFSEHHVKDRNLSNHIRARLPFATFTEVERTRQDWRDDAVNQLLELTKDKEYILFLEQDFLVKDKTFFDKIFSTNADFIYYKEGERIHPAFAVVKRDLIDKTSKFFGVYPPGDHFYKFFTELPEGMDIDRLGVKREKDYYHMAGLSQNYMSFEHEDPFYRPINFLTFNYLSLQFPNQHPLFYQLQQAIENKFGHPKNHMFMRNFFPAEFKL